MSEILLRIRNALAAHGIETDQTVIYLGRCEWYDLLRTMHGWTPVHITYVDDVRRCTCYGVEVIAVDMPKYLRVA